MKPWSGIWTIAGYIFYIFFKKVILKVKEVIFNFKQCIINVIIVLVLNTQ